MAFVLTPLHAQKYSTLNKRPTILLSMASPSKSHGTIRPMEETNYYPAQKAKAFSY